jgi:CHAT domain-containing protein
MQKAVGRARPRIHWCPTGGLTFLPLHAAGIYAGSSQECCSDYVVSSYTPTLTALVHAQERSKTIGVRTSSLLVVAADNKTLPPLPNVELETYHVIETAVGAGMMVEAHCDHSAVQDDVAKSLESAHLVHVASHGIQNAFQPLQSGLCLNDGILTVERLMKLDLKDAFFAFLSACETAKGDKKQPDQAIHLAATLLFTGFSSVVGTMWCVYFMFRSDIRAKYE